MVTIPDQILLMQLPVLLQIGKQYMKIKLIKTLLIVIGMFGAMQFALLPVSALTIGISPISVENQHLKPGATSTTNFRFSLSEINQDMPVKIAVDDQGLASWLTFDTGTEFLYKQGQKYQDIKLTIKVPENAELKDYSGVVRFNAQGIQASNETTKVVSGTRIDLKLKVTNEDFKSIVVTSTAISISEDGNTLNLAVTGRNEGNVNTSLEKAELIISDLTGKEVATYTQTSIPEIKAFESNKINVEFSNTLKAGQYYVNAKLYLKGQSIYENKLVLTVVKDGQGLLKADQLPMNVKDFVLLAVATILGVGGLLFVLKMVKKDPSKPAVVYSILLALPILLLIGFYGYYGRILLSQQQNVSDYNNGLVLGEKRLTETNHKNMATFELLNEKTIIFNKDSVVYKSPAINPEVLTNVASGSAYSIIADESGWYKLEISPNKFAYLPKINQ